MPQKSRPRTTTFHDRILNDVKDKILNGVWRPGDRIPFETDLARQYGVSRMTVNKALTQLTRAGFLQRRRKLGTVVCLPRVQSAVLEITDIEREITSLGRRYSYILLSRAVGRADEGDGFTLAGVAPDTPVLRLHCVHNADDIPFCSEQRLINLIAAPDAEALSFATEPPGGWLLRKAPWNSAEHTISAISAGGALAATLRIKPGTACLVVERRTEFAGTCVTRAKLSYPGEMHQLVAQFSPRSE